MGWFPYTLLGEHTGQQDPAEEGGKEGKTWVLGNKINE